MLLVYLALAWVTGIAVASIVTLPLAFWAGWLALSIGLFVIWRKDAQLRRLHLCLLTLFLSAIRYSLALPPAEWNTSHLPYYNGHGSVLLVGNVVEPPDRRDRTVQIRLAVTRVRVENEWQAVSGLALVDAPREAPVQYGDQVQVFGEPETPLDFSDWSYKDYLARQGVESVVRVYGEVKILARDQGNGFYSALYAVRDRALASLYAIFPDPAASLLAGILLGMDSGIPRDLSDAFSRTNTAHIIAISGFNISILAGILAKIALRTVGRRRATIIVILGLALYTLLVGASASVVRAAIMGMLSVLAIHYGRQNDALNALAGAALLMLAWNPLTLYDLGFQLSFLATVGLVLYVVPLSAAFERLLGRFTAPERARQIVATLSDSVVVTVAAQITTTPLIVFAFHRLSLIGLLANFFVLPAQPAVMLLGGLATLTALIVQPLGQVLAWIAWPFLEFTIAVVQLGARLPLASIELGRLDVVILVAYYVFLFGGTFLRTLPSRPLTIPLPLPGSTSSVTSTTLVAPTFVVGIALVAGFWFWNLSTTLPDGKTHVQFLNTGGSATLIRTPAGRRLLIDGGSSPSSVTSAVGQELPFWDRSLDLIVLTNVDDDHLAGLVSVLERYDVRQIVEVSATRQTALYQRWRDLAASKLVPSVVGREGLRVALDQDVSLEVLPSSKDASSLVVRVRTAGASFLFAQGADIDQQEWVAQSEDIASAVLIPPYTIAPEFIAAVNPQFTILFTGRGTRRSPSAELLSALSETTILRTDERGTIEMIVDRRNLAIK